MAGLPGQPPLGLARRRCGGFVVAVAAGGLLYATGPSTAAARGGVPAPAELAADVVVSGRTSTARNIKVVAVGGEIPQTFSGDRVHNSKGFTWYVSRHYALKTDYPAERARHFLEVLELAYPHYVELFGAEPEGIAEKRMAVVYASGTDELRRALADDGIRWDFSGGGITFEGCRCAYQYPSGDLRYHHRYILLHEGTHLFQMCLTGTVLSTPAWYYEGIAELLANHVYERARRRLTVNVVDKATTNNPYDQGLREYRKRAVRFSQAHAKGSASRGMSFLMVAFFHTDPGRLQRLRIYRDEMLRRRARGAKVTQASARLLRELFGPWEEIDAEFARWVEARRSTFHYAEWGWEQDAQTLWSYGYAPGGRLSRTDVDLPPGERPQANALRMDYPAAARPALVGEVRRGVAEPAVAALVDFSRTPGRGVAGIGLGLVEGRAIRPLPPDALFVDAAGKTPGVRAAAYRRGTVVDGGRDSGNVANDRPIGRGVERRIALGGDDSVTAALKRNYVVEWDGWLKIARPGEHEFVLASDDGSWLWIDGRQIINNGGLHEEQARTATVRLASGLHRIRVRYFQCYGPAVLKVGFAAKRRPGCLKLLVGAERELIIDGRDLGLERQEKPLPDAFCKAMAAGGHKLGLHARIAKDTLVVTLRARDPAAARPRVVTASLALGAAARRRLLTQPAAVLSRGGRHGVTPFFDPGRGQRPADLSVPAPPNRWRNPGDRLLYRVTRAAWRLGGKAPASLGSLRAALLAAATASPAEQKRALAAARKRLPAVLSDIGACAASADHILHALAELKPL